MASIEYKYTRNRDTFGRHVELQDSDCTVLSIPSSKTPDDLVRKKVTGWSGDCIPYVSDRAVNTATTSTEDAGASCERGLWPRNVDPSHVESIIRHRRKIEKSESYAISVSRTAREVTNAVETSNASDVYEEYFADMPVAWGHHLEPGCKVMATFSDRSKAVGGVEQANTACSDISWRYDGNKFAVGYCSRSFSDHHHARADDIRLSSVSPLSCLAFQPRSHSLLVGGRHNGTIGCWDIRESTRREAASSSHDHSHSDPTSGICWTQSKSGLECCSVSADGKLLWWDTRRLSEPLDTITLEIVGASGRERFSGISMGYHMVAGVNKMLVGTQEGQVLGCNRKPMRSDERVVEVYSGHHGPVNSVDRNPFFPKYFMSVGDWSLRVWTEGLGRASLQSEYSSALLTCGGWSPTRPGVLISGSKAGMLQVWDVHNHCEEPILEHKVTNSSVQCLAMEARGGLVAFGDSAGGAVLVELNEVLSNPKPSEKRTAFQTLEREARAERTLEMHERRQAHELGHS